MTSTVPSPSRDRPVTDLKRYKPSIVLNLRTNNASGHGRFRTSMDGTVLVTVQSAYSIVILYHLNLSLMCH